MLERLPELWQRTGEHLFLTGVATGTAVAVGIPLGILCTRVRQVRGTVLSAVGVLQTIPSLAMLAILLSLIGQIGAVPAIIALILYALLPIVRNTVTGLEGVEAGVMEAARGVGMTRGQRLWMVRIPLALPVIVAGIRTAAVIGVGIATLSAFIGAGGLGQFINRGLALNNARLILFGAVPAATLALLVDFAVWCAEWGMRRTRQSERRTLKARLKRPALAVPVVLVALGVVTSTLRFEQRAPPAPTEETGRRGTPGTVRIGTKEFAEQRLLGEMMAQLIEARTHLTVQRQFGLGGTMICHGALVRGAIDLYAEYTGTGYQAILERTDPPGPYSVYATVRADYGEKFAAEWLEPFGFNNTYAMTVRAAEAEARGWETISDLVPVAGRLKAGFTGEFMERSDGYPGLRKAYGIQFAETVDLDAAVMYEALRDRQVDVICAFSTNGKIAAYDLRPLTDDRRFFPPYDAAPVVRQKFLKEHPELRWALAPVQGLLDDATMQRLNYETEGRGRSPPEVAREFLQDHGLIE